MDVCAKVEEYGDIPSKAIHHQTIQRRPNLFHYVTDPRIPPTNNATVRGIREIVVHRKVCSSLRAKNTMIWLGNLFSCVPWREMDVTVEMAKYLG